MFCYYVFSLLRSNLVTEECVLILWIKFHIFSPMDHLPGHRVLIVLKSVTPNHLLPLTMHTPTLNTVLFIFLEVNFVCSGFQINVYSFVSSWFCSARHFQRPEHGLQVSHFFFLLPLTSIPDYEQASLSPAVFSLEFCPADFLAVSLKSSG